MSGFQGWWVNGKTGKGFLVSEHGLDIQSFPERYGFTEDEVKRLIGDEYNPGDTSQEGGRGRLLSAAMSKGWVRVRGYRGAYVIQTNGHCASYLPKVLQFLKKSGVGQHSQIRIDDLLTGYSQNFVDGMPDILKDLKAGKIPDTGPISALVKKGTEQISKKAGIPITLNDKQARTLMRQRIGQKSHVPDPNPDDNFLPEHRAFRRGLKKLIG